MLHKFVVNQFYVKVSRGNDKEISSNITLFVYFTDTRYEYAVPSHTLIYKEGHRRHAPRLDL